MSFGSPADLPIHDVMNFQAQPRAVSDLDEIEITDAAVRAYGRLLRGLGRAISTHSAGDGGLICEDVVVRGKPTIWRISPDGELLPDRRYNFVTRAFAPGPLPHAPGRSVKPRA